MAAYNPEEGRPPDSSPNRKYKDRKHSSLIYPNGPDGIVNNNLLTLDVNRNVPSPDKQRHSLRNRLLCIKKEPRRSLNVLLNVAALAGPSSTKRASFHQDVEEALNSLLWQPYEYQKADKDDQWPRADRSRDARSAPAASRPSTRLASVSELLDGGTAGGDAVSEMQLEVNAEVSVLSVPGDGGGGSLSSANVVGLPVPRNGSEPRQLVHQSAHLRSASVPKTMGGQPNVSSVNVNFYRAVPVNVVASVPTIQCLNTRSDEGNSVSNVQIMPLGTTQTTGTTQVTVHTAPVVTVAPPPRAAPARTFTSTEAQTDEISVCPPPEEQRRKERRERRHQRRANNHRHTVDSGTQATPPPQNNDRLPDLLNSHMPPPYSPLPNSVPPPNVVMPPMMVPPPPHGAVLQSVVPNNVVPSGLVAFPPPQVVGGQVPLVQGNGPVPVAVPPPPSGFRFPFPAGGFRRGRFSEEPPKGCCGLLTWKPGSLRWFIAVIALIAVCCVLVGTALGAMRPAGRDHLTVSLLMIGVGIVLVTVSGVAWRLTSHDSSTCRSMLGLGSTESVDVCTRRFVPRLPPSYGRPHHPYAAMMYPEFQYRPPPPSYQASMQEYRLRLLLLDRGNTPQIQAGIQNAVSPPPTYRSHAGSLLRAPLSSRRDASQSEYSCPPSYRSQSSTNRPGQTSAALHHSREHSLSLSESNNEESVVNVVNILAATDDALDNITLDSLKLDPAESDLNPLKMLLKGGSGELDASKEGNLVTIVQTGDQSPVIVTVSGSSQNTMQIAELPTEMEILAHL